MVVSTSNLVETVNARCASIVNTANMQSETGFSSSHQLKPYVASKSRLKLAARAVLSADAGLLVVFRIKQVIVLEVMVL